MKKDISINIYAFILSVLIFIGSIFASWYNNKTEVELLKASRIIQNEKIDKINKTLEANNLELINYKLDQILKALGQDVKPR